MVGNSISEEKGVLQQDLLNSLKIHAQRNAFFINDAFFTYDQLHKRVARFQSIFRNQNTRIESLGIIANNDFDTYSAIVACLLSGITYIPIEPSHPDERNNHIINALSLDSIYCSDAGMLHREFLEKHGDKLLADPAEKEFTTDAVVGLTDNPAYILFTSGTTGVPKGVPITTENLQAFVQNIDRMGIRIDQEDRFLQVFDLTFDLSVFSYLIPLLKGACVYTLPRVPFKFTAAISVIEEKAITHVLTVPSFVSYLEPYFKKIRLPDVRYWLFCGEALRTKLVSNWQQCVPNADILNVYGPTEATIFCSYYRCPKSDIKDVNGVVCIGKPFHGTGFALMRDDKLTVDNNPEGELCIQGRQLTSGYLNNESRNKQSFITYNKSTFYRTGDICLVDQEHDYFYLGRNDTQVKISGYRIELGEIEDAANRIAGIKDAVAVATGESEEMQILLFLVAEVHYDAPVITELLKARIPEYMLPKRFIFIDSLPYNLNGKIDRKALLAMDKQMP